MTVEDEKVADGPTVPVMDVRVTCSHPLFRFKDIAYHMESNEPTNIAEPLVFHDNRHTSFSFGSANGTVSCQGVFALGIVGKGDVQPETPVYAVFAFYVPIGDNEVKHFMTLAECEPNIDLVRHKGPLKKAYDWNFRHRLMPHNCPIFHGGAIENETFIVRATIAQGSRSRLIISMEPLLESEKVCYHEPHFFVAPRADVHRRLQKQSSFEDRLHPPPYIVCDPEDSLFVNLFVNHPNVTLRKASHFVVTGMVGDDLTESVSMDKPGTGYFLSTLDCKSRGNIVYEVMTTVDVVNKVEKKRSDRYYLVVSWQVNPNKPVPSLEQKHEQEGDHRYKVAAMVLKAASPGFPARGFSQKQFFDTTGNFVLAGQVQEWTYPLTDDVSFNLVAKITGRDEHMREHPNGLMYGRHMSAAKKYTDLEAGVQTNVVPIVPNNNNNNTDDSNEASTSTPADTEEKRPMPPVGAPHAGEPGYLEPAVLDIFINMPGPPLESKFKDVYTGYMLYAPASGFYWENYQALLKINSIIPRYMIWEEEDVLQLVEHDEHSVMQLRRIYETPFLGKRVFSQRPGDQQVMEPKRYDIFELRLKSNRTYRSVYAVEELKSTSPVSQHRQYVVNSCLMGRAGTSVVYGFMDNPNKLDDGAAVARFLDVVRVDLIALPGGLFEYNLPLVRSGQIGIKHFLNFGGPNIASTVISTTRSQAMPANTVMKTKSNKLRFKFINSHADVKIVSSSVLVLGGQCIGEGIRRINLPQEQSVYVADITPIATHPGEGFAACFRFELEEPEVDCDLQVVEIYVYRITSHTLDHPAYAARSLLRTKKSCRNDKHPEEKPANIIPPEEQLSGQNNYRSHELPVEETLDDKKYLTLDEMAMENCYLAYQVYENTELPKTVRASPDDNDVLSQVVIIDLATPKQFMQTVDPLVEGYINDTKRCYVGVHLRANDSDDVVEVIGGIASLASRSRDVIFGVANLMNQKNWTPKRRFQYYSESLSPYRPRPIPRVERKYDPMMNPDYYVQGRPYHRSI